MSNATQGWMVGVVLGLGVMAWACGGSKEGGKNPGDPGRTGGGGGSIIVPTEPPDTQPTAGPVGGSDYRMDIGAAIALAVAVPGTTGFVAVPGEETEGQLASVQESGEVKLAAWPETSDSLAAAPLTPQVRRLIPVGSQGTLVVFRNQVLFRHTQMAWLTPDGGLRPFAPEDATPQNQFVFNDGFTDSTGTLWLVAGVVPALYSFDFSTQAFTRHTDENQMIDEAAVTDDGEIWVRGKVASSNTEFVRHLRKPTGFDSVASEPGVLGFVFKGFLVLKERMSSFADGTVVTRRLSVPVEFPQRTLFYEPLPQPIVNNRWVVSSQLTKGGNPAPRIVDVGTGVVAENPLARTESDTTVRSSFRLDTSSGLSFDGTNLAQMEWDGSQLKANHVKTLLMPSQPHVLVRGVYGDSQGFTGGTYGVLAERLGVEDKLYYTTMNAATGVVDQEGLKELDIAGQTAWDLKFHSTIYKVGSHLVLAIGNAKNKLLHLDTSGAKVVDDATLAGVNLDNLRAQGGVVHENTLYVPKWGAIVTYSGGALNHILPDIGLTAFRPMSVAKSVDGKPLILALDDGGSASLYGMGSWAFDGTAPATSLSLGFTSTVPCISCASLGLEKNGNVLARNPDDDRVYVYAAALNSGSALASPRPSAVVTQGAAAFGAAFVSANSLEVAAPWSDTAFLAAGRNVSDAYRAFRVAVPEGSETLLPDLNGVQVYSTGALPGGKLVVNGLRVADNVRVTLTYDDAGTVVARDETSNIKTLQIVPAPAVAEFRR